MGLSVPLRPIILKASTSYEKPSIPLTTQPQYTRHSTFTQKPQKVATGGKKTIGTDAESYEVWNYKLYLEAEKDNEMIRELLVAESQFQDAMITILFAGDIDGDGLLDLIINATNHYNAFVPTLYLSKAAAKRKLLKVVAQHASVGC